MSLWWALKRKQIWCVLPLTWPFSTSNWCERWGSKEARMFLYFLMWARGGTIKKPSVFDYHLPGESWPFLWEASAQRSHVPFIILWERLHQRSHTSLNSILMNSSWSACLKHYTPLESPHPPSLLMVDPGYLSATVSYTDDDPPPPPPRLQLSWNESSIGGAMRYWCTEYAWWMKLFLPEVVAWTWAGVSGPPW